MHKRSGKDAGFVERKCDCNLQQVCYNFHWLKTKCGGDIFEKNSNIFWNASGHASDVSDRCLGSRKWRNNHSGAGMAVHSFCGAATLHCRDAADQS